MRVCVCVCVKESEVCVQLYTCMYNTCSCCMFQSLHTCTHLSRHDVPDSTLHLMYVVNVHSVHIRPSNKVLSVGVL